MSFDRTNAADLAALKTEVLTDPTGAGYNPSASEAVLLDLLNNPAQNKTPATGPDYLTPLNVLKGLMPVSINSQDQFKIQLVFESAQGVTDDISVFRPDLVSFGGQVATAINGINRALSRAEILFAEDDVNGSRESVVITTADWRAARDS